MKIADAKSTPKSFVDNGKIKIVAIERAGKIAEFTATKDGTTKVFTVKDYNVLAAWKQLETFLADVK